MTRFRAILAVFLLCAGASSALAVSTLLLPGSSPQAPLVASSMSGAVSSTTTAGTSAASGYATHANASTPSLQSTPGYVMSVGSTLQQSAPLTPLQVAQSISFLVAPLSWLLVAGAWIWRGRVRARWREVGFESDIFELFMKMRGGATRIRVLDTLTSPKDRLQVAQELGLDWKAVDRHVQILNKHGFVRQQAAYGTVRMYETTALGRKLLNLFSDIEGGEGSASKDDSAKTAAQ